MRRITKRLLTVFLCMLLIQCTSEKERLNKVLNEMADNLNVSTPLILNQNMQLDSAVVSADNVFIYYYTIINAEKPVALMDSLEVELNSSIKKSFKIDERLRVFKENKVTIKYIYSDSTGSPVRTIKVTPEDYN